MGRILFRGAVFKAILSEEIGFKTGLDALPPVARAELLHVLVLPDFDRADRVGAYWANPKTRTFAELLIDCEEDKAARSCLGF